MIHKDDPQPPRWAKKLLEWFCPADTLEEIEGDLAEIYIYWQTKAGKKQATIRYVYTVMRLIRPFSFKQHSSYPSHPFTTPMLVNYLTIAFRNLSNNKAYSFINMGGLAMGMAVAMLIGLWIHDEL